MEKNIKDYMHLYINVCKYRISFVETPQSLSVWAKLIPHRFWKIMDDASVCKIQIALRPLTTITDEECKESDYFSNREDFMKSIKMFNTPDRLPYNPKHFVWFLSKGFDLFGLIEAGVAIDSTTLKTTE